MRVRSTRQTGAVIALIAATTVALSACVESAPQPTSTPTPTATSTSEPETPPTGPILRPDESAAANHQFFDLINREYHEANGRGDGRTIVNNLVENGFLKQDMEVTADTTAIGLAADSIVVSVRIKGDCLLGQFLADSYVSSVEPLLGTGSCLVGKTRPIDW